MSTIESKKRKADSEPVSKVPVVCITLVNWICIHDEGVSVYVVAVENLPGGSIQGLKKDMEEQPYWSHDRRLTTAEVDEIDSHNSGHWSGGEYGYWGDMVLPRVAIRELADDDSMESTDDQPLVGCYKLVLPYEP